MAKHAVWSDIVNRYRDIVNSVDGGASEMESAHIRPAEHYIEGRLANRISPIPTSNMIIQDLVIDEVYHRIVMFKHKGGEALRDWIEKRLDQIIDGELALVDSAGDPTVSRLAMCSTNTGSYHSAFGNGLFEDFCPDSSQIYAERIERYGY